MSGVYSLRARLVAIILTPLILVASAIGLWQLATARSTAKDVFDRNLLSVALAVANDVAVSDGDALSPATARLLENSSGGPVFYHVYAPDGVIVAGYATPPVGIPRVETRLPQPQSFEATYLGRDVTGVRLQTQTEVEGFVGTFTTTVWQDRSVRDRFVYDLLLRTLIGLGAVIASVAIIVWFGVRLGLRPLLNLERAIAQRSSDDLSRIRRAVPREVQGIVQTLNALFRQVSATMEAQSQFVSNAAHQLRNPIAGVLSLAEAVSRASTAEESRRRVDDLLQAARATSDLTQRLLLHERARAISPAESFATHDAQRLMTGWARTFAAAIQDSIAFHTAFELDGEPLVADATMLQEAIANLIDNAVTHGGTGLTHISLSARATPTALIIAVTDDGIGLPPEAIAQALTRFAQVGTNPGSGLGLSIAEAIAEAHGGSLHLISVPRGLRAELHLPRTSQDAPSPGRRHS